MDTQRFSIICRVYNLSLIHIWPGRFGLHRRSGRRQPHGGRCESCLLYTSFIAVSIEGEQSAPSLSQAQKLRELDKEGKLNPDAIDGILSQEKKEVDKVILSTAELSKYFGKEVTPRQMKDQIMALLDEWKEKQPPEKKAELEK